MLQADQDLLTWAGKIPFYRGKFPLILLAILLVSELAYVTMKGFTSSRELKVLDLYEELFYWIKEPFLIYRP